MNYLVLPVLMGLILSSCSTLNKNKKNNFVSNNLSEKKSPSLITPKVRKVWIPEKIDGDKYIEGHWMWVLERTTTWSQ